MHAALDVERGMAAIRSGLGVDGRGGDGGDVAWDVGVAGEGDAARVGTHVDAAAIAVGFGAVDRTKVVTAASELACDVPASGGRAC